MHAGYKYALSRFPSLTWTENAHMYYFSKTCGPSGLCYRGKITTTAHKNPPGLTISQLRNAGFNANARAVAEVKTATLATQLALAEFPFFGMNISTKPWNSIKLPPEEKRNKMAFTSNSAAGIAWEIYLSNNKKKNESDLFINTNDNVEVHPFIHRFTHSYIQPGIHRIREAGRDRHEERISTQCCAPCLYKNTTNHCQVTTQHALLWCVLRYCAVYVDLGGLC